MKGLLIKKEVKGITLVALVITIIVLLILAGVSIAMLSGENGILGNAEKAIGKSENAQTQENATLADYENEMEKYIDNTRETVTLTKEEYDMFKNITTYSNEEKRIGTFSDGKAIYRKTLIGDTLPANGTVLISNVETIVNVYGEMLYNGTIWYPFPYAGIIWWEHYLEENAVKINIADTHATTKYKWTFEYTKVVE